MATSEDYLKKIMFYFLTLDRAKTTEAATFKGISHDDLCNRLSERIEMILSYFQRYRKITYKLHGLKEEGSDVALRYYVDDKSRFICFELKSYGDLKKADYLKKIKAQYVDSQNRYNFEDYYVILATDEHSEKRKIAGIKADLIPTPKLTIIDPSQYLFFLRLKPAQVGAIVKAYVEDGDLIVNEGSKIIAGLPKTQYCLIFLILDLSVRKSFLAALEKTDILSYKYLKDVYESLSAEGLDQGEYDESVSYQSNEFVQMVEEDLESLSGRGYFEFDPESGKIIPDYDFLKPIVCLILEGQLKYEFNTQETIEYLEELLFG
jgi:hypothetical protein